MRGAIATLSLVFVSACLAGDDVPPPPSVNPEAKFTVTRSELDSVVRQVLDEYIARHPAVPAAAQPAAQIAPYAASPQGQMAPMASPQQATYVPTVGMAAPAAVNVLVQPGPCRRAIGALGEHLARKAAPKVMSMQLAPPAYVPSIGAAYTAQPVSYLAPAVKASPQVAGMPAVPTK